MRWGTSRIILFLGAITHGGFLLFMSHYSHSSSNLPGKLPLQPKARGINEKLRKRATETAANSSASVSTPVVADAAGTAAAASVESDAMDLMLKSLGHPRSPVNTATSPSGNGHDRSLDIANTHSQTPKSAPAEKPDAFRNSGGSVGNSSLEMESKLESRQKESKKTPVTEAKKPSSKKKQLKDTLIDSWSGEPNLDDIIDPMVRHFDVIKDDRM
jgi:hypothetical protein